MSPQTTTAVRVRPSRRNPAPEPRRLRTPRRSQFPPTRERGFLKRISSSGTSINNSEAIDETNTTRRHLSSHDGVVTGQCAGVRFGRIHDRQRCARDDARRRTCRPRARVARSRNLAGRRICSINMAMTRVCGSAMNSPGNPPHPATPHCRSTPSTTHRCRAPAGQLSLPRPSRHFATRRRHPSIAERPRRAPRQH